MGVLRCGKETLLIGTLFTWHRQAFNEVSEVYYNIAALLEHIQRFSLHFRVRIGVHRTIIDRVPWGFYQDFNAAEPMRDVGFCGAFEPKKKDLCFAQGLSMSRSYFTSGGLQALAQRSLLYYNTAISEVHSKRSRGIANHCTSYRSRKWPTSSPRAPIMGPELQRPVLYQLLNQGFLSNIERPRCFAKI